MRKILSLTIGLLAAVILSPPMTAQVTKDRQTPFPSDPKQSVHLVTTLKLPDTGVPGIRTDVTAGNPLDNEILQQVGQAILTKVGTEKTGADGTLTSLSVNSASDRDDKNIDRVYDDLDRQGVDNRNSKGTLSANQSAMSLPTRTPSNNLKLRAVITADDAWNGASNYGVYDVPLTDDSEWTCLASYHMPCMGTLVDEINGKWWYQYWVQTGMMRIFRIIQYDIDTWQPLEQHSGKSLLGSQNKIDPTDGLAYGANANSWQKVDFANATTETIGTLNTGYVLSLAVDKQGQFYAMDDNGRLYKIDKSNGSSQFIGQTGLQLTSASGACINNSDNTMIVFYSSTDTSGIAEVDLTTAETTILKDFGRKIIAADLYMVEDKPGDVPAQPEMIFSTQENSLDVTLNLNMPTTLNGGDSAPDAEMNYRITNGLDVISEGSAMPGQTITANYAAPSAGQYWFKAIVSNGNGNSPAAVLNIELGYPEPVPPTSVVATWEDGTTTLTWDAVTVSVSGNPLPASEIKYTVYGPDEEIVAENISETQLSCPLPQQDGKYELCIYKVTANYGDTSSKSAESNLLPLGYFNAPYSANFRAGVFPEKEHHVIIDANQDDATWIKGNVSYFCKPNRPDDFTFDDWFIYPGIYLEKGKAYEYATETVPIYPDWIEKAEIMAGFEPTPEAMTITVMEAQQVPYEYNGHIPNLNFLFIPEVSGRYFFGTHMISENQNKVSTAQGMSIDSYSFSEPLELTAPGAMPEFAAVADPAGQLSVDFNVKAPETTIGGSPLSGKVNIVVTCEERVVKEISVDAGGTVNFTDTEIPSPGSYIYKVRTYGENGNPGLSKVIYVKVGPNTPAALTNVQLVESAENHLKLSWDPVTKDVQGNSLPESNITYEVYEGIASSSGLSVGEKLTEDSFTATSFECDIPASSAQRFHYLVVRAANLGVYGQAVGESIIVGPAYDMPVQYTDQATTNSHILGFGGSASLYFADDSYYTESQDDDNAMFVIIANMPGDYCKATMGKVKVEGKNPRMSFYVYGLEDGQDENVTKVYITDNTGESLVRNIVHKDVCIPGEWNLVEVDLTPWQGKTIKAAIRTDLISHAITLYDNILFHNRPDYDLTAKINAPLSVRNGEEFEVVVAVNNLGIEKAGKYSVSLLRDGDEISTEELTDLSMNGSVKIPFAQTLTPVNGETVSYQAVVRFDCDEMLSNNTTKEVTVVRRVNPLPVVSGLTGSNSENGDLLNWNAIDLSQPQAVSVMEDFESGESFASEFGNWIMVDADKSPFVGFSINLPNITGGVTSTPFIVFDNSDTSTFNNTWFVRPGGTKCLVSLQSIDPADDWAISPLLTGEAQKINFFARSYHPSYPNTFEVYYSDEDSDFDYDGAFERIATFGTARNEWSQYEVELPEGARRFAFRSKNTNMALFIDDVTFRSEMMVDATLLGYNIYCDDVKITDSPVAGNEYIHPQAEATTHSYRLSAVYDKGESELSEPVMISPSGVGQVNARPDASITSRENMIVVSNADGMKVSVVSADGKMLHSGIGDALISVPAGVYIVSAGHSTVKLLVK